MGAAPPYPRQRSTAIRPGPAPDLAPGLADELVEPLVGEVRGLRDQRDTIALDGREPLARQGDREREADALLGGPALEQRLPDRPRTSLWPRFLDLRPALHHQVPDHRRRD